MFKWGLERMEKQQHRGVARDRFNAGSLLQVPSKGLLHRTSTRVLYSAAAMTDLPLEGLQQWYCLTRASGGAAVGTRSTTDGRLGSA